MALTPGGRSGYLGATEAERKVIEHRKDVMRRWKVRRGIRPDIGYFAAFLGWTVPELRWAAFRREHTE